MPADTYTVTDKLTALAALFAPLDGVSSGSRNFSVEACNGICMIIEDCTRDLDQISRLREEQEKAHREKINKLNSRITELRGGVSHERE